jgi:hypothetical protein
MTDNNGLVPLVRLRVLVGFNVTENAVADLF